MNNKQWRNKQTWQLLLSITTRTPCLPLWSHQLGSLRDWLGGDRKIWSLAGMWSLIATRKNSGSSGSIPLLYHMIAATSHWWGLPIFCRTIGQLGSCPLWLRKQGGWMCHARSLELSDRMLCASPHVSCSRQLGKYGSYWAHGGWKPLHQKRRPAVSLLNILVPWCPV